MISVGTFQTSPRKDLVSTAQFRMEAAKKFLQDMMIGVIEAMGRGEYARMLRAKLAEQGEQPPARGILGRVFG